MKNYCAMPDIYFDVDYAKLYEKIEKGTVHTISVENEHGSIISHIILRKIPVLTNEQYYDIVTPYGYGGPIITSLTGEKNKLLDSFYDVMQDFVQEHHVVSEFVRFHPIFGNGVDFKKIYNSQFDRKTVGTNLRDYEITEEFSKSAKKYIRRAEKAGITYEIIQNPVEVEDFKKIYYSTMDRDNADAYYYFCDEYFEQCIKTLGKNILYVKVIFKDKVIAAGFYFVCGNIIECHLSGTLTEYLNLSPAYITKIATARWGKENGIQYIHYGGGTSRNEENSLYQFKKKFGKNTEFDFYIGKKIWNKKVYTQLCQLAGVNENILYFPAYRTKDIIWKEG